MSATNISLLAASLTFQLVLLTLLFLRRNASQLRLFTVLLCFYALRSTLLVLIFGRVVPGLYAEIYTLLSALDVLLQIALALEIAVLILRGRARPYAPRVLEIPAIFLFAALTTAAIAASLPAHSRAPADRGSIFTGLLFIGLLLWSRGVLLSRWGRSVLTGLAGIGAAAVTTQLGRSLAAIHQDAHAFRSWSYLNAAVYILTLVFWIVFCKPKSYLTLPTASRPHPNPAQPIAGPVTSR